ncbi:hypothetical protein T01_9833 [Trichinella spiralis]|uniref:RING-type domain-containing protein n=1 Tax=Trichinella spiralis TaxID=6334 RepID=A0A0V1BUX9_TRISP|nr:hypothetical protein T01_9833 [Trichinella spiralis]
MSSSKLRSNSGGSVIQTSKSDANRNTHRQAGRQADRQTDRQVKTWALGEGHWPQRADSGRSQFELVFRLSSRRRRLRPAGRPTGRTDGLSRRPSSWNVALAGVRACAWAWACVRWVFHRFENCRPPSVRHFRTRLDWNQRFVDADDAASSGTLTTRVANCGRENVGRRLTGRESEHFHFFHQANKHSNTHKKKVTPAEPWPDRAGQQQMVILADFLMPWRLCRKLRRRPLLPWSLVDGRCATRTLGPSSNLGVAVDDSAAAVENELNRVRTSVELMLNRMDESPDEALPNCSEEECVVCLSGKASLQTFPCGHMVLCRRCFVKTIQVALDERQLPLRCIICRSRIVRLKQQISSRCRVAVRTEPVPMFSSEFESSSMPSSAIRRPGYC